MKVYVLIVTPTAKVYHKLKMKQLKLKGDIKLLIIKLINLSNKSKQNKQHWLNKDFNIKRKIKHCLIIVVSFKRKRNKWIKIGRELKISIQKYQNFIQLLKIPKMIDKRKKINMSQLLLKEIFQELNLSEEMMNLLYFMRK